MYSSFLGQIIGFYLIILSISMLIQHKYYNKIFTSFYTEPALMCLGGILKVIIGLLIVMFHNVWEESWATIITIIGWIILLSGIYILLFPKKAILYTKKMIKKNGCLWLHSISLIVGLYLVYLSYYK